MRSPSVAPRLPLRSPARHLSPILALLAVGALRAVDAEPPRRPAPLASADARPSQPASGAASESRFEDGRLRVPAPHPFAERACLGAYRELLRETPYRETYETLAYPGGDVEGYGVCTDLVIRAFRDAGCDLQERLHEDRKAHPEVYPTKLWEHRRPDRNIDHRRCPNLRVWFARHAESLPPRFVPEEVEDWKPGDVVFHRKPGADHPWHVAIVSEFRDEDGMPLVVDNFPPRTGLHRLDRYGEIGWRYRVPATGPSEEPTPEPVRRSGR